MYDNVGVFGGDINDGRKLVTNTWQECCAKCRDVKGCKAFSWGKEAHWEGKKGACWLKGGIPNWTEHKSFITGMPGGCPVHAHCHNCECDKGYEMKNGKCEKIPCYDVVCPALAKCNPKDDKCYCQTDYKMIKENGKDKCVPIDPCKFKVCTPNSKCKEGLCICDNGYWMKDGVCIPEVFCEGKRCDANEKCACKCACKPGYARNSKGVCEQSNKPPERALPK